MRKRFMGYLNIKVENIYFKIRKIAISRNFTIFFIQNEKLNDIFCLDLDRDKIYVNIHAENFMEIDWCRNN